MITAFGTTESAVEAMKLGAYDYITKPLKSTKLELTLPRLLKQNLEIENRTLKRNWNGNIVFKTFIGKLGCYA